MTDDEIIPVPAISGESSDAEDWIQIDQPVVEGKDPESDLAVLMAAWEVEYYKKTIPYLLRIIQQKGLMPKERMAAAAELKKVMDGYRERETVKRPVGRPRKNAESESVVSATKTVDDLILERYRKRIGGA